MNLRRNASPLPDRIDSSKGYTKDNVCLLHSSKLHEITAHDGGAGELVPAHCGTAKRKVWLTPNLEQIAFLLPPKKAFYTFYAKG